MGLKRNSGVLIAHYPYHSFADQFFFINVNYPPLTWTQNWGFATLSVNLIRLELHNVAELTLVRGSATDRNIV